MINKRQCSFGICKKTFKDVPGELEYIFWARNKIKLLLSAINNNSEFEGTSDIKILSQKLKRYIFDYSEAVDDVYEILNWENI